MKDLIIKKLKDIVTEQSNIISDDTYGTPHSTRKVLRLQKELKALESSQPDLKEDFPEIDFRKEIAEELSRQELIDRLCEMNKSYTEMRKEWFEKVHMNQPESKENPFITKLKEKGLLLEGCSMDRINEICDKVESEMKTEKRRNNSTLSYIDCMMRLTGSTPFEEMTNDDLDSIYASAFGHWSYHMSREGFIISLNKRREELTTITDKK